jgi:hypothetical protein
MLKSDLVEKKNFVGVLQETGVDSPVRITPMVELMHDVVMFLPEAEKPFASWRPILTWEVLRRILFLLPFVELVAGCYQVGSCLPMNLILPVLLVLVLLRLHRR